MNRSRLGMRLRSGAKRAIDTRRGLRFEGLEDRALMTATAVPDVYRLLQDTPLNVAASGVLANDLAASNNPLTITSSTRPAHGTLALNPNGTFVYTPTSGFSGTDLFNYTISDGKGGTGTAAVTLDVIACPPTACVEAGPRLASVNSTQGATLNALLGSLLGSNVNLSVLDSNALAQGQINGPSFLGALKTRLGVANTSQALTTNATLSQVLLAAADAAAAGGDTASATALNNLQAQVGGLTGTIKVGDLLQIDPNNGDFATSSLNALDLVTGAVELFNFKNVATTTAPITVSGAALGLGNLVNSVQISAQVVEPPIFTCGPVGTTFHTAALRTKMNVDLIDSPLNTSALNATLAPLLGPLVNVQSTATLGQFQLYTEVARGNGTITAIDALAHSVTIQATPGVSDVYLGTIPDSVFFNRTHIIDPATDLGFGSVGTLSINATSATSGTTVANGSTTIDAKGFARGQAPFASTLVFNGPFPQTQTASTSAAFATNLANDLAGSLQFRLGGTLGPALDPLVNGTILPAVRPLVTAAITPALAPMLTGAVDPLLKNLGIGLGQMDVTVTAVGEVCPPQANNDVAITPEDTAITIPVLANDAIATGDTVTVQSVTPPAHGTAVINPNGTVTYTPVANYNGPDSFTYTIVDPAGATSTATVAVSVTPVNDAPVAVNDSFTTPEDTTLTVPAPGVLVNDTDADGDPLTSQIVAQPAHGTVTLNPNGSFTYTPAANYNGPDAFTYQDSDGKALSNLATVNLTVTPVNDAPVANNDIYSTTTGTTLTITVPGVLSNDTDVDGDPLTAGAPSVPAHGTVTLNPNGSLTYTPTAGFNGTDTFTYQASDGKASSNVATVTINIAPTANSAPVAVNDTFTTPMGTPLTVATPGVLVNDTDANGDPLTSQIVAQPAHGTVTLNPNGSFTYTPVASYNGPDSFTYQDSDGKALSNVATVNLTVTPVNRPPVANNDLYSTTTGTPLTIAAPGVLGNDTDPDGDPLTAGAPSVPAHGTVTLNANGSLTYTPTAGFNGTDTFTYQASDGKTLSNVATVTISIGPGVNRPPAAVNDSYTTPEDTPLTVPAPGVLGNDTDPEGNPLVSVIVAPPTHGTVTLNFDGSLTYTPAANYNGPDSFTYQASDGTSLSNVATVSIAVSPVNDAPIARDDAYTTPQGVALTVPAAGVLVNDTDVDGDTLTSVIVAGPSHGTVTLNPNGSFTYTPAASYNGADSFTYQASDGKAPSNIATVRIGVTPVNQAPAAVDDTYTTPGGITLTVNGPGVLINDTDANGDTLTSVLVTPPTHGTVTLNPNGSFTYTPGPGYTGPDLFTYRANDGKALSDPATVRINVQPGDTGAQILGLQRFGFHNQSTFLVVRFSEALDPVSASNIRNYTVTTAGGRVMAIRSATYVPSMNEVVLSFRNRLTIRSAYQVQISDAVRSSNGVGLDGLSTKQPGTKFTAQFDRSILIGPASNVPGGVGALHVRHRSVKSANRSRH
ncbi:MAG: putative rane protein [Planctomycetota bacterium]|nr:putative rane protein [Planctomycetota bacterium]